MEKLKPSSEKKLIEGVSKEAPSKTKHLKESKNYISYRSSDSGKSSYELRQKLVQLVLKDWSKDALLDHMAELLVQLDYRRRNQRWGATVKKMNFKRKNEVFFLLAKETYLKELAKQPKSKNKLTVKELHKALEDAHSDIKWINTRVDKKTKDLDKNCIDVKKMHAAILKDLKKDMSEISASKRTF
jgi:hypothetical protein